MSSRPPFIHSSTSYAEHHHEHVDIHTTASTHHSSSSHDHTVTQSKPSNPYSNFNSNTPYSDYPGEKVEVEYVEYSYTPHLIRPSVDTRSNSGDYTRRSLYPHQGYITANNPRCRDAAGGRLGRALIIGWVVTTLMFVVATAFYKGELFSALDGLSIQLREMGYTGQAIFAFLIFITTIPPLPLYSTLMVLSGYTFGARDGFLISYGASLIGAVVVFLVARTFLRDCITKCLSSSPTSMSLLNIIPAKPHLLLLIRIAPYPYNLLNVILASSPTLTLKTYTSCTAVSLLKVILHTWFGSGIHDISELHRSSPPPPLDGIGSDGHKHHPQHGHHGHHGNQGHGQGENQNQGSPWSQGIHGYQAHRDDIKVYWTWGGLGLCVVLFVYLHHVAKKALARAQAEVERDSRIEQGHVIEELVHVGR